MALADFPTDNIASAPALALWWLQLPCRPFPPPRVPCTPGAPGAGDGQPSRLQRPLSRAPRTPPQPLSVVCPLQSVLSTLILGPRASARVHRLGGNAGHTRVGERIWDVDGGMVRHVPDQRGASQRRRARWGCCLAAAQEAAPARDYPAPTSLSRAQRSDAADRIETQRCARRSYLEKQIPFDTSAQDRTSPSLNAPQ